MRAVSAHFQGVQRQSQVVDWACRRSEVVNEIDFPVDVKGLGYVDIQIDEISIANMRDVFERSGLEIVDADNSIPALKQRFT
jgi:hypothetical protein